MTENDDDLLPAAEAAREFDVHRSTIFQWIAEGSLRGYQRKGDRRTFVSRSELRRLTEFHPKENGNGGGGVGLLSLWLLALPLVHGPRSALLMPACVLTTWLLVTLTGSAS